MAMFFLGFGAIPELNSPTYADMRNRVRPDGSEWLQPKIKAMFSQKLNGLNCEYGCFEKAAADLSMDCLLLRRKAGTAKRLIKAKLGK